MGEHKSLAGSTVLVVEDDFYLADDARDALEAAGARVLGPCPRIADALPWLHEPQLSFALLDVNLSDGPSFDLARAIGKRGIPILFVTGYDETSIPADLAEKPRLQKPTTKHQLVSAVCQLLPHGS